MFPADGQLVDDRASADICIEALTLLKNSDPSFLKMLEESAGSGCKVSMFFLGALRYRAMGRSDPEALRHLNDSGSEGYSLYEFLYTYPAEIGDYFNGRKEMDDGLLERVKEWFDLPSDQKEYFRKRALSHYGKDISENGTQIFNTPTKYSDWIKWKDSSENSDGIHSIIVELYMTGEYRQCIENIDQSKNPGLEDLFIAGKCYLALSNSDMALKSFRSSADKGHPGSCYEIYLLYEQEHMKIDPDEARKYLDNATLNNIKGATDALFDRYLQSPSERPGIFDIFRSAFEKGNYNARAYEGFIHFFGIGKEIDHINALQCFEDVYGRCQYANYVGFLMGYMYTNGIGCEKLEKRGKPLLGRFAILGKSPEESLEYIRKSITERGH